MSALGVPAIRTQGARKLRVLVVDDSVVIRQLISRMLTGERDIEVVGSAKNGVEAVAKVEQLKPDLVTLDVEMPELDGTGALKLIKQQNPQTRVLMCSSLTTRGAKATIDALMLGADDYVAKEHSGDMTQGAFELLRVEIVRKVYALFPWLGAGQASTKQPAAPQPLRSALPALKSLPARNPGATASVPKLRPKILVIGVSTGGPSALAELMPRFPASFPLPIVIVQHMPAFFTTTLAERLDRLGSLPVQEAADGMVLEPGKVLLAPGDFHLRLQRAGLEVVTALDQGERVSYCRPSVDVLFQSVSEVYGGAAAAVVLTGMGQDGCTGAKLLHERGATVFAQDKETSVVWGMPGAIVAAKIADAVLPLTSIYPAIARIAE